MDSKNLFPIENNGYSCEEVEKYITTLKAEYKKIYEYAAKTKSDNEKLKKICRALSAENKQFKANAAKPQ